MSRRKLTVPLLAAAILSSGVTAPAASAATYNPWANFQKQIQAAIKKAQEDYKRALLKAGVNPAQPFVAKGFTFEIPVGNLGTQVGGLGVNVGGTGAAVAVGTALGVSGDLYLVDTLKKTTTLVPQSVALPFDGSNAVSVDGKRVVFMSGFGPLARPYAFTRGKTEAVKLSTKATSQPTLSTDGGTYAIAIDGGLLGKDSIGIGDPSLGITQTIETAATIGTKFSRPQLTADGRYVGYLVTTSSTVEFHTYDQKYGTIKPQNLITRHTLPAGGTNELLDWSWDARRALVAQTKNGVRTLFIVDLRGLSQPVATLAPAVNGESSPTLSADGKNVALATPTPTDATDTNNATDLAWVNYAGTKFQRQSFDADSKQLVDGIGLTPLGFRIPRFAVADTAIASFWVGKAPEGGGETVYVRTTLPVKNPPVATPAPTTPVPTTPVPTT